MASSGGVAWSGSGRDCEGCDLRTGGSGPVCTTRSVAGPSVAAMGMLGTHRGAAPLAVRPGSLSQHQARHSLAMASRFPRTAALSDSGDKSPPVAAPSW